MTYNFSSGIYQTILGSLLLLAISCRAFAQPPLEEISLEYEKENIVATINLSGPVHYLRHFPAHRGKTLQIYYDRIQDVTSNETWQDDKFARRRLPRLFPVYRDHTRSGNPAKAGS